MIALARNGSPLATSTPEHCGNGVPAGHGQRHHGRRGLTIRFAAAAVRGATSATRRARRGAGTARTTASACQRAPFRRAATSRLKPGFECGHRRPHPAQPAAVDQLVEQHLVAAAHRTENRSAGVRRQRLPDRVGQAGRAAIQRRRHTSGPPRACRSSPPNPRKPRPAADPPSGPPPARRTGRPPARPPPDRRRPASSADGWASAPIRAIVASSTSPATDAADVGMPLTVSGGSGAAPLAVDQRPHAGGADLPVRPGPARPAARASRAGAARTPRRRCPSAARRPVRCAIPRRAGRPGRTA